MEDDESKTEIFSLPAGDVLLRWLNHHLRYAKYLAGAIPILCLCNTSTTLYRRDSAKAIVPIGRRYTDEHALSELYPRWAAESMIF